MKNFDTIYKNLKEREKENAKKINKTRVKELLSAYFWLLLILIILGIIICLLFGLDTGLATCLDTFRTWIIISILITFIVGASDINNKERKEFYQNKIIGSIVAEFNDYNMVCKKGEGLEKELYNLGSFEKYHEYNAEGLIIGNIKGKNSFQISDVKTTSKDTLIRRGGITFYGSVVVIELEKSVEGTVDIKPDKDYAVKEFPINLNIKRKNQIEIDSSEFENYFDVIADNRMLALEILTPDIMGKLINIIKIWSDIEIKIIQNKLFIRISGFPSIRTPIFLFNYSLLKRIYQNLGDLLKFMTELINKINDII